MYNHFFNELILVEAGVIIFPQSIHLLSAAAHCVKGNVFIVIIFEGIDRHPARCPFSDPAVVEWSSMKHLPGLTPLSHYFSFSLKKSMVRCQASSAAGLS